MSLIHVESQPGEGLALLTVRYFGETFRSQLWTRVKARKAGVCAASGREYGVGAAVYRPSLGNPRNRSQRIIADQIEYAGKSATTLSVTLKPCPFCGCSMGVRSNRDWHRIYGEHAESCVFEDQEPMTVPATDKDLEWAVASWNQRAPCPQ